MIFNSTEYPIVVEVPKVLSREQVQVYVPYANASGKRGIATFNPKHFVVDDGVVSMNGKVYWDLVIKDITKLRYDYLLELRSNANVYVSVNFDEYNGEDSNFLLLVPPNIRVIDFGGCTGGSNINISIRGSTDTGDMDGNPYTCIRNLNLPLAQNLILSRLTGIKNCSLNLSYESEKINSTVRIIRSYNINNCNFNSNVSFEYCASISDLKVQNCTFDNCVNILNVQKFIGTTGSIVYRNCKSVVGNTCDDYYSAEDVGKVQAITLDGSKHLIDPIEKITMPASYRKVYAIDENGDQDTNDVDFIDTAHEGSIPVRNESGNIYLPNEPQVSTDSTNKSYVDKTVLNEINEAKITLRNEFLGVYQYIGSVNNYEDLPKTSTHGYVYNVKNQYITVDAESNEIIYPAGTNFAWTGSGWDALGGDFGQFSERLAEVEGKANKTANDFLNLGEDVHLNELRIGSLERDVGNISTILTALHEGGIA